MPHGTRSTRTVSGEDELSRRVTDLLSSANAFLNAVNASLYVSPLPLSRYQISNLIRAVDTVPPPPSFITFDDAILWAGIRPNLPLVGEALDGPVDTDEGGTASASTNTKKSGDR